jgi:pyruvate,orthophosphate dikinase
MSGRGWRPCAALLEGEFRDAQEFEFTVQDGELFLLQTRSGKRTPWAALRIAVDQVNEGLIAPDEGAARLDGIDLDRIERGAWHPATNSLLGAPCRPASAWRAAPSRSTPPPRSALPPRAARLLVREDTLTEDIAGLAACEGLLTVRGSRTAHAAVVARQLGKPCLVGCGTLRVDPATRTLWFGAKQLREGEVLTLDCDNGHVLIGEVRAIVERPTEWLHEVARWSRPAV